MTKRWQRVGLEGASTLLDFAGARPGDPHLARVARGQLLGAVALHNRLATRRLAWLSDEVGMGKTYVALGVVALLRHQHPDARVLFIVPNARLQEKWMKELGLFSRSCVRTVDHRVRTIQGGPARTLESASNLYTLAARLALDLERDAIVSMSAFSFGLGDKEDEWDARWQELARLAPRLPPRRPPETRGDKMAFKRAYACALNAVLPDFDLVVCDEAHNLRAGVGHAASRNLTLGAAIGGAFGGQPRAGRLLCLTATPVERRYEELARQADVFGIPARPDLPPEVRGDLESLGRSGVAPDVQKGVARAYVVRRLQELRPDPEGPGLTKNQYRREWRQGGLGEHDGPMDPASDRERLIVALVQKRVIELLHRTGARTADGTFLPSFQMGMLSSFESFSETIARRVEQAEQPIFDGEDQTADARERQGIDSATVDALCRSYRERFGVAPPHPKLDQVADHVAEWAAQGDKTLVFVRRVRTTEELADKVAQRLDEALLGRLEAELPSPLRRAMDPWVAEYRRTRRSADPERPVAQAGDDEGDEGGSDTFFAYFFRGTGKAPHQVAARLRRETFQRPTHPWSVFFHDNYALGYFGDDADALRDWAARHREALEDGARRFIREVKRPGPQHLFEAWQASALELLGATVPEAAKARDRLYPDQRKTRWSGDPGGPEWLLIEPFFTRLRRSELREALWPSQRPLAEREVRRELLASAMRLGLPFVSLWLTAVEAIEALEPTGAEAGQVSVDRLADRFLDRLRAEAARPGHTAWRELQEIARHFPLIMDTNFADVSEWPLTALNRYFQAHLSRQSPVLAIHGGSRSTQALTQFRMPGFPLALVATDVLQEGVDLHTFCARVVHYGIAHTSSATEQRTGRVDRIGSLVHRRFHGADEDSRLQVHYPHLRDTVEPLQLQELYRRMDLFLRLVHDGLGRVDEASSRVVLDRSMAEAAVYPAPPRERLRTAFDVVIDGPASDLDGGPLTGPPVPSLPDLSHVDAAVREVLEEVQRDPDRPRWTGTVRLGVRQQPVRVELRTRRDGGGACIRVTSPLGPIDLSDGRTAGAVLRAAARLVGVEVAADPFGPDLVARGDSPLPNDKGVRGRIARLIRGVAVAADDLEQTFSGGDLRLDAWRGGDASA